MTALPGLVHWLVWFGLLCLVGCVAFSFLLFGWSARVSGFLLWFLALVSSWFGSVQRGVA